jgi:hypothetical protein
MSLSESATNEILRLLEASPLFDLRKPGDVMQCPPNALCKGDYYIMGFNPGMQSQSRGANEGKHPKSLRETTKGLVDAKDDPHPLQQDWPRGWTNLAKLVEALPATDDWQYKLFITNLFPEASCGVSRWLREHGGRERRLEYVNQIWPLHQHFLSIVKPRFLIVHGQGSRDSAFRYLWEFLVQRKEPSADWNDTMSPATVRDQSIKSFRVRKLDVGNGEALDIVFIGIKHLSRSQSDLNAMVNGLIKPQLGAA